MMISFFIIRLYVMRIKGQKENLTDERLRIETLEGKSVYIVEISNDIRERIGDSRRQSID